MQAAREKEKRDFLVLDAGDLLFKKFIAPIPENDLNMVTDKTQLIIESFNLMGYDAVGIGDDDLSLGKEFLLEISKKANFPFLSSNIVSEESGKLLFQPYLIRKINDLRIGIFSLIAPDIFPSQSDIRKKGLAIQSHIETAQKMVKELQPKTDLIILLSHLGYPKDIELAQTVPGIHMIVGGHTGINLVTPPTLKNTLIVQMGPKGMYIGRLNLTFYSNEYNFFNSSEKVALENSLKHFKERVLTAEMAEIEGWYQNNFLQYSRISNTTRLYHIKFPEDFGQTLKDLVAFLRAQDLEKSKSLRTKVKEEAEKILIQLQDKNEFTNGIFTLNDMIHDHPEIGKMIEAYRSKYPGLEKPASSRSEAPRPVVGTPRK